MVSPCGVTYSCNLCSQVPATLGVHVDASRRHLHWPQMAELVEGPGPSCACCMALGSIPTCVAWHGRRVFPGCQPTSFSATTAGLVLGALHHHIRRNPSLGWSASCPRRCARPGLGRDAGLDLVAALWQFPTDCLRLAAAWSQREAHHVFSP